MPDINTIMFYVVALDALAVLAMGIAVAIIIVLDMELTDLWHRIMRATVALVVTSFASGLILWIGDKLFVG